MLPAPQQLEDKPEPFFQIPAENISVPAVYKVGEYPKECSTRGDKLYVGDLIAFLGPSQFTPYWIVV